MPTVDGYESWPRTVAAIIDAEIDEEALRDPSLLYAQATKLRARLDKEVDKLRGLALAQLNEAGMSYRAIAEHVGISSARVQQLINKARGAG